MARLYSGKRGSSGSTRPVSRRPPSWFKYEPEEIDALVLKLSKEGNPPSIIGQILRDRYGVPLVLIESKIHRLASYYRAIGRLPKEWQYKPVAASLR